VINIPLTTTQLEQVLVDLTIDGSERETFMGIKGNVDVSKVSTAAVDIAMAIVRVPKGHDTPNLSTITNTEIYPSLENLLWSYVHQYITTATDALPHLPLRLELDIKSKRKLRPGDTIAFISDSSASSVVSMMANLNIFSLE